MKQERMKWGSPKLVIVLLVETEGHANLGSTTYKGTTQ